MPSEAKRGAKEASRQFGALRARWPKAFPANAAGVRPLAVGVGSTIAAEMGWTSDYVRGVLRVWKSRDPYCRACLVYSKRIALDGSLTDELVDGEARAMARELIERRKERKQREAQAPRAKHVLFHYQCVNAFQELVTNRSSHGDFRFALVGPAQHRNRGCVAMST